MDNNTRLQKWSPLQYSKLAIAIIAVLYGRH